MIRWLFLFLGDFENWLEGRFVFSRVLLFVLLHFLFCAEDAVYIGTHGLEFFVIILEIAVSIVLGVLLNRMTSNLEAHLDDFGFDAQLVKSLVQRIEVSADKRIRIVFGFQDVLADFGKESAGK